MTKEAPTPSRAPSHEAYWSWLVGAALVFLFFTPAFTGEVFCARDMQRVYLPLQRFWTQRVLAGALPGWYPYDGLGQSFPSMVVSGAFHPFRILGLLFGATGSDLAITAALVLAYLCSWTGTYFVVREWRGTVSAALVGACSFAFAGYMVSLSNNLPYVTAAAALPWALLYAIRFSREARPQSAVLAAVALSTVALAGDPENFTFAAALAVVVCLVLRPQGWRGGGQLLLLSAGMSALQWAPALAIRSVARGGSSPEAALTWSGHPLRLLEVLLGPVWFNEQLVQMDPAVARHFDPVAQSAWADTQHVGLALVALAAVGAWTTFTRKAAPLWGAMALICVAWLGRHTPLGAAMTHLPIIKSFRYPEKLSVLPLLALSLLAAAGFDSLAEGKGKRAFWAIVGCGGLAVALELAGVWTHLVASTGLDELHSHFLVIGVVSIGAAGAVGLLLRIGRRASGMAVAVIAVTLWWFDIRVPWYVHRGAMMERPAVEGAPPLRSGSRVLSLAGSAVPPADIASAAVPEFMVLSTAAALRPDTPASWDIESADAYLPAGSGRMPGARELAPHAALFGVETVVTRAGDAVSGLAPAPAIPGLQLEYHAVVAPLPMAFFTSARAVVDASAARAALDDAAVRAGRVAVVERDAARSDPPMAYLPVQAQAPDPDHLTVAVRTDRAGVLVVNRAWDPGWSARVDGRDEPIVRANLLVQAVQLEPGAHEVQFEYHVPGLRWGAALSGMTLLLGLIWCVAPRFRKSAGQAPTHP